MVLNYTSSLIKNKAYDFKMFSKNCMLKNPFKYRNADIEFSAHSAFDKMIIILVHINKVEIEKKFE